MIYHFLSIFTFQPLCIARSYIPKLTTITTLEGL